MAFGPELVTNGTFNTNLSSWSVGTSWTWVAGRAFYHNQVMDEDAISQILTFIEGHTYRLEFDYEITTAETGATFDAGFDSYMGLNANSINGPSTGHFSGDIIPTANDVILNYVAIRTDFTYDFYVDNVSLKENYGDLSLQTTHLSGADTSGDVQTMNVGKDDDSVPIYYELETQELEFSNRAFLKAITDKLGIISQYAEDGKIEIIPDNLDAIPINIDLGKRVSTTTLQIKGHYITLRWSGNSTTKSPILEGFYLNKIKDDGFG